MRRRSHTSAEGFVVRREENEDDARRVPCFHPKMFMIRLQQLFWIVKKNKKGEEGEQLTESWRRINLYQNWSSAPPLRVYFLQLADQTFPGQWCRWAACAAGFPVWSMELTGFCGIGQSNGADLVVSSGGYDLAGNGHPARSFIGKGWRSLDPLWGWVFFFFQRKILRSEFESFSEPHVLLLYQRFGEERLKKENFPWRDIFKPNYNISGN